MKNTKQGPLAPELSVSQWFNAKTDMSLEGLRGRPVLIHAFQMLCPGCVSHAIPQTQKAHSMFWQTDLAVLGLHTVFEHHEVMTPDALEAFIHEYQLTFPIGVDKPGDVAGLPETMARYRMQGTPTTILIDRNGRIAMQMFGQIDDMVLGAAIQTVLGAEADATQTEDIAEGNSQDGVCNEDGCLATAQQS